MRVCIDVSAAVAQTAGIARYVRELTLALHRLPDGPELSLFHNYQKHSRLPAELSSHARTSVPLGNKLWRLWILSGLPVPQAWTHTIQESDLFHATDVTLPKLAKPCVITVCDLTTILFPQYHSQLNRWYQRIALPGMLQHADAVIAISQATKDDLVRSFQVDPARIPCHGAGRRPRSICMRPQPEMLEQLRAGTGLVPPYLLAVGTLEPRKNLIALLHAYATLPPSVPPLVLAGGQGWGNNPLAAVIEQLGLRERVRLIGYVPDEFLPALYSGAEFFVYPSLYEGFGLPVLEAMACGTPVITSNVSSLPEVAGNAAVLVNPKDVRSIADAISIVWQTPELRQRMRIEGLAQAATFTWQRTARETIAVYLQATTPRSS